jgi:cell division transport system permease protein
LHFNYTDLKKNTQLRYGTNFLSSLISIGLVLFLLGLIGVIILHAGQIAKHVKENITITVMLKDDIRDADRFDLQKELDANPKILSTLYVTPEEAANRFIQDTGEDFVEFLGYIPLPPSLEVHMRAEYAEELHLSELAEELKKNTSVKDVFYEKDLVDIINDNVARITLVLLSIAVLMFIISMVLINNTMRLHIYSKRFLIKSMLLIGASHGFIRKPFLIRGLLIGCTGGIFAIGLLLGSTHFLQKQIPDLTEVFVLDYFALLVASILIIGILLSILFSVFAVRKYVRLDLDTLHR